MTNERRGTGGRRTAEERREAVLDAAIATFAVYGLHGASTEAIAARAGISQPYVFRLFGTKKDLFIAAMERVCDRVLDTFQSAAATAGDPDRVLDAMGHSFVGLLSRRDELLLLLQSYAACEDAEVRQAVQRRFGEIYRFVEAVSHAGEEEVRRFMAYGMLLTVGAAMDLPALAKKEEWARKYVSL